MPTAENTEPVPHEAAEKGPSLTEIYYRSFELIECDTPELVAEAQKIRYQVYCVETGFEDASQHPDGLEKDEYDDRSIHALLIHRASSQPAGTVRLILPDPDQPRHSLPALSVSDPLADLHGWRLPVESTAEISRFAISREFRQRLRDSLYPGPRGVADDPDVRNRRAIPSMTLGLMRSVVAMGAPRGITHVCALVEPALIRLLARVGVTFFEEGQPVDYHGLRKAVWRDFDSWSASIHERNRDVWSLITDAGRIWPLPSGIPAPAE